MAHKFGLLVFVFLAGLLAACGQNEVVEEVVLVTETAVSPTIAPTTKPSATATTIPTETPTQTPSATPTATTIPTHTPMPTFAPDELETAVADLLANPMNCDVPCWWGAVPGKTTVFEIEQFLNLYQYHTYFNHKEDDNQMSHYIQISPENGLFNLNVRYGFEDNVLKFVTILYSPTISSVIEKFGQPDEVLISASNNVRTCPPNIQIYLVYLQESMAFGYSVEGTVQDDWVKACFTDETGQTNLKRPNSIPQKTILDEFAMFYPNDFLYFPLEDATKFTMADFMQHFSDPNQPQCIETPIDLWGWD